MNSAISPNPIGERVVRHGEYYIQGGDVIFRVRVFMIGSFLLLIMTHRQVENYLFRVHRFFFTRDSAYFWDKLPHPPPPGEFTKGSSDNNPFILEDTLKVDFERFLWVFYNPSVLGSQLISPSDIVSENTPSILLMSKNGHQY